MHCNIRGNAMEKKKISIPIKLIIRLPLILGIIILATCIILKGIGFFKEGKTTIITSSTLIDTVNIAELSTSEFTYNGIAELPKGENSDKIKCRVRYAAKVKASVNMEDIDFVIDKKAKNVTPVLPEIQFKATLNDQEGLSFIPEGSKIDLQEVREICKEDVLNEATRTSELYDSAVDNLKDIIQALTYPLLQNKGYTLIWT